MYNHFKSSKVNEKGQGLVEYALILVLVAIVVIAAMMILGPTVGNVFNDVNSSLEGLTSGGGGGGSLPTGPTDFGSTQWKNGFDTSTPINNYCASEGTGSNYNLYSVNGGSYTYYIASGQPWTGSGSTFMNTGSCP